MLILKKKNTESATISLYESSECDISSYLEIQNINRTVRFFSDDLEYKSSKRKIELISSDILCKKIFLLR